MDPDSDPDWIESIMYLDCWFCVGSGVFETKVDEHIGYPRTEYHCKKCGGHHGHIFEDGPKPTGKRYCNNGACLIFKKHI